MSLTLSQVLFHARSREAAPRTPLVFDAKSNSYALNGTALNLEAIVAALESTATLPNGSASGYKRDKARCEALGLTVGKTGGNFRRLLRRLAMMELVQEAHKGKREASIARITVDGNGSGATVEYVDGSHGALVRDGNTVKVAA